MKLRLLVFTVLFSAMSWGQVNLAVGGTYNQNFDGLGTAAIATYTNNTTLAGWYISTAGLPINTGTTNANSCYNFGVAGTNPLTDRALGAISTATTHRFGLRLLNNGASDISSFNITFTGEQWRSFNAGTLTFDYQTGATVTSLTTGTWTNVPAFTFSSLNTSGGAATDGNSTTNRTVITGVLTLAVPAGTEVMFRWVKAGTSSPGLAVDDLSITANGGCTAPSITTHPATAAQNICQGSAATALSVVATGTTLNYQWYSNTTSSNVGGTLIAGATSSTYTPTTVSPGTTYYYCIVTGACGSPVTSNVSGAITVNPIPADPLGAITISANPSCGPATLSYPAGYYWQTLATGTSTLNPTSSNYTLNTTGTIYVRAFNGSCWSTNSLSSGAITINTPVAITTQPSNSTIFSGSSTSFSVVASGTGLTYQWQVDTGSGFVNLSNVAPYSNVTTATMNITAATVAMNGYLYRCVVSGASPCAAVNSNSALLTVNLYVPSGTVMKPGDMVFVGYDSTSPTSCAGAEDKFYIANLVDILPGTQFLIVNSRYESGAAANTRTDKWYSGGSAPYDDPGIITFTWGGGSSIPKGSVISFRVDALVVTEIKINNVLEPSLTYTTNLNQCNISSADPDQIYIMQGLFTPFGVVGTTRYNTFTGRVLYGLTNGVAWVPFSSSVSAGTTGGATRESRLPDDIECFNIESTSLNGVRFYNNSALHTGTKYQLLSALINTGNWTIPANTTCLNTVEDFTGVTGTAVGGAFTVTAGNPDGTWTGATDTDWFKCSNWEGLAVPKATDDVFIPVVTNKPIIGASPAKYVNGAYSNNLTIDNGSSLSMPNALSRLNLYGNWTNNAGNVGFIEGLGTLYFEGVGTQVINNVTPEGTETFYNVILNNNFNTSTSNNLIATGNLTVNATKTLDIATNGYVQVDNNLTNNGTVNVANNASLIQVNDAGVDTGNINVTRSASQRLLDYIYWSAPVINAPLSYFTTTGGTPAGYIYSWGATTANPNGGEGYWNGASGNMVSGKGYIVRGSSSFNNVAPTSWNATFTGVPNNGIVTIGIQRGNDYTGIGTQGIMRTAMDDNWNLIGNPYPSALGVNEFLTANASIQGFVKIWTHGTLPTSTVDPFYQDFQTNYYATDYITVNGTGLTSGPGDYKIGAGQGFFVAMNPGAAGVATVTFNNSMRSRTFANNQFYKFAHANTSPASEVVEKNRIWLDLVGPNQVVTRTLVGYVMDATDENDRLYDAVSDMKNNQSLYSLLNNEPFSIQGRKLPFDALDTVKMGVKIPSNGNYTIAIAAVDGLFADKKQKIFIEDKLTNTVHDISQSPYAFTATQGIVNDRFVLRYTQPLKRDQFVDNAEINVFVSGNQIEMVSGTKAIKNYTVYNVLGQVLVTQEDVNKTSATERSLTKNNQALIVKITFEDGQTATKKIVF